MSELIPFFAISLKGSSEDLAEKFQISSFTYEDAREKDSQLTLKITSPNPNVSSAEEFVKGSELVFFFGYRSGELSERRWAVVSDVEPTFYKGGRTEMTVRAFDKGLFMKKKTSDVVFVNKTASQIALSITQSLGMDADIKRTSYKYDFCPQSNRTDFEFLHDLAGREHDYYFGISGNSLIFKPNNYQKPSELTISLGPEDSPAVNFKPKMNHSTVDGAASGSSGHSVLRSDGQAVSEKAKGKDVSLNEHRVFYDADGKRKKVDVVSPDKFTGKKLTAPEPKPGRREIAAENKARRAVRKSVTATLNLIGLPGLKAGQIITVSGVGDSYTGNYMIESVTHQIAQGYTCRAELSSNALRKTVSKTETNKTPGKKNKSVGPDKVEKGKVLSVNYDADGKQIPS